MSHLEWRTPYELYHGRKPDISKIRTFGCGAHVFLQEVQQWNKLSSKTKYMIYLGHTTDHKNYMFMHTHNNVLVMADQAIFNETHFPKCKCSEHPVIQSGDGKIS